MRFNHLKFTALKGRAILSLLACATVALTPSVWADDFPSKPIRLVVAAPPGGGTDAMARIISSGVAETNKWQMVVENLPGAGGNIGLEKVAKAPGDGYTLAMGESANLTVNQFLYARIPFKVETDLIPVTLVAKVPLVLIVPSNSPYKSVADLVAAAKKKPLSFASAGNGSLGHLVAELWKRRAGVDLVHVPYRGASPAMTDLAGGQTDMYFATIAAALPMVNTGKVRALAITSIHRAPLLQDVPTMAEIGFKGLEANVIFGVVAPRGTSEAVVTKLNAVINEALKKPSVIQSLIALGADRTSFGGDVRSFGALLRQERTKWSEVVKESGAKVD